MIMNIAHPGKSPSTHSLNPGDDHDGHEVDDHDVDDHGDEHFDVGTLHTQTRVQAHIH